MHDFVCDVFDFADVLKTKRSRLTQEKQGGRERSVSAQTLQNILFAGFLFLRA